MAVFNDCWLAFGHLAIFPLFFSYIVYLLSSSREQLSSLPAKASHFFFCSPSRNLTGVWAESSSVFLTNTEGVCFARRLPEDALSPADLPPHPFTSDQGAS